jgi:hypothetical protein
MDFVPDGSLACDRKSQWALVQTPMYFDALRMLTGLCVVLAMVVVSKKCCTWDRQKIVAALDATLSSTRWHLHSDRGTAPLQP